MSVGVCAYMFVCVFCLSVCVRIVFSLVILC